MKSPGPAQADKRKALEALFREDPTLGARTAAATVGCCMVYASQIRSLLSLRAASAELADLHTPAAFRYIQDQVTARLRVLQNRVNHGQRVLEASEFTRWLQGSGIIDLCPDAQQVRQQCKELIWSAGERLGHNDMRPTVEAADMVSLTEKIDRLEKLILERAA